MTILIPINSPQCRSTSLGESTDELFSVLFGRETVTGNSRKLDDTGNCFLLSICKCLHYVRGKRAAIFSRVVLGRSGNWMSNCTIMSPRRLGSFEYGRPSPAICRTVVGFIMSGIFRVALRLLSVGTLTVTPPRIACTKLCTTCRFTIHRTQSMTEFDCTQKSCRLVSSKTDRQQAQYCTHTGRL